MAGKPGDEESSSAPANAAAFLRSLEMPATVRFRIDDAESPLLLAAMNAAAAVASETGPGQARAAADLASLWDALLPLLSGLSEPLRVSRRLHKIVVATQRAVNILLKNDEEAMVFAQDLGDLARTQDRVVQSFSERVDEYFRNFPTVPRRPQHVPHGYRAAVSLETYEPPEGLERGECATCLIRDFIEEAHEMAKRENSQFKYVKAVANATIERWHSKFLENMMRLEQDCLVELQRQINEMMQISGLVNHADWQANLQSLIVSPIEAVGFGVLSGSVIGVYAGTIANAVAGVGFGFGLGVGAVFGVLVAAILLEDTPLAKNLGVWSFEDGQLKAAQTVLDVLNQPEFQKRAKDVVLQQFEQRLRACMDQLAALRDPNASSRAEARTARGIQERVADLQRSLSQWFMHFVSDQVGRDPWLVPPPKDLQDALLRPAAVPGGPSGGKRHENSDSD